MPDPQGLLEYYRQIAAATSQGVLPYARDAADFPPGTRRARLARQVPNLIAFKDGCGGGRLPFERLRELSSGGWARTGCSGWLASAATWWRREHAAPALGASRRHWPASGLGRQRGKWRLASEWRL